MDRQDAVTLRRGHKARLELTRAQSALLDEQASAAITVWTKDLPGVTRNGPAGRVTGARLVKDAFGWSIVFRTETLAEPAAPHQGETVGIDRGITVALALSDGTMREHGPWLTAARTGDLADLPPVRPP